MLPQSRVIERVPGSTLRSWLGHSQAVWPLGLSFPMCETQAWATVPLEFPLTSGPGSAIIGVPSAPEASPPWSLWYSDTRGSQNSDYPGAEFLPVPRAGGRGVGGEMRSEPVSDHPLYH